jgi:ribokinase
METQSIVVVGSANVDLIMKMDRLPRVGETVTDAEFIQTFGGKGANQAVAAARAGGKVVFVGCVGDDSLGGQIITNMSQVGVNVQHLYKTSKAASGTALIMIGSQGENYLSVAPGANYQVDHEQVDRAWGEIESASMVMVQAEIPIETIHYVIDRAASVGKPVMFNVAPARPLGDMPLNKVTMLLVNETEAAFLTGLQVEDESQAWDAVDTLLVMGPRTVILTMGANGCLVGGEKLRQKVPAYRVQALDTTAAGDVFCGALAAALVEGKSLLESLEFAAAAAAICVTRLGAQPSIPHRSEIDLFILRGKR